MTSPLSATVLPSALTALATIAFLVLERVQPGRELPHVPGWYGRCLLVNLVQLLITVGTVSLWPIVFGGRSFLHLSNEASPLLQGFCAWLWGTFVFYWWHRLRHANGWWLLFHQLHHSPPRIETLTSFYKHPIEILADSFLSAVIIYPVLGCSIAGALWYNLFAAAGEYFYHSNVRTPRWLRFLIQTPELHSIHHQTDVHRYNFGDLPLWDRLFGTYKEATGFADRCGFPRDSERHLVMMLAFRNAFGG